MKKNSRTERRIYKRFPIKLRAQYLQENDEECKGCIVSDISRGGMGIIVYIQERMPIGSSLQLEIIFPKKEKPIKASGVLKWIKQQKLNFMVGIELTKIDSEDKWILLDCAYDKWFNTKESSTIANS